MNGTPHPTININYLCGIFIKNFLSVIFSSCNPNATSTIEDYTIAYMVIKILKYLCEDHNTKFQSIFFQDIKIEYGASNVCIFELMMCTLNKIVTLAQWDKVGFGQDHLAQGDRGDFPAPERLRRGLAFLPELRNILSPEGPEGGHHPLQGQRAGIELPEGPASAQDTGGGRRRPGRKREHIQNQGHSQ